MREGVATSGLTVVRADRTILDLEALQLPAGRMNVLVGPNGAGKSTLLRAMASLLTPTTGQLRVFGSAVSAMDPKLRAQTLAWVPDHHDAPFPYTVRDVAIMGRFPWHGGRSTSADRDRADAALSSLGIEALAHRTLPTLSSGERQRAMLARAIAGDAPLLLLDEPTASLDIGAALALLAFLKQLAAAGRTIVASLHDLTLAARFADHVLVLHDGKRAAAGAPTEALAPPVIRTVFGVAAAPARTPDGKETLFLS